ncbi:MAG: hypothetical protein AB1486_02420 [Planctomycetota bacterium]
MMWKFLAAVLVVLVVTAACGGPAKEPGRPPGASERQVTPVEEPPPGWYATLPPDGEYRYIQAEAEAASREEALLRAQDIALEESSQQLATMVQSAIDRRLQETRDATLEQAKVQVQELSRADLQVRSNALLRGWKKEREEARSVAGGYRAWVRLAVPAEHFDMSRSQWFLARAQDAAQLGQPKLERLWYEYGVAVFPQDLALRKAFVDALRARGTPADALNQAIELVRLDRADAHLSLARQLAWRAFNDLSTAKRHVEAREALGVLITHDLGEPEPQRVRDTLAASARVEAAEEAQRGRLVKASACLDEALGYGPQPELANDIKKDRDLIDRKLRNPFGSACEKLREFARRGEDSDLLRLRCDDPVLRLSQGRQVIYSLWSGEERWLWTLWIEAEAVYSVDMLKQFSGRKVGKGNDNEHARLAAQASTPPGPVFYLVLAGRGERPSVFAPGEFAKEFVNDPYSETKDRDAPSQAERLEELLATIERGISSGDIVTAGFEFRVMP